MLILSWNGREYTTIKNSAGNELQTSTEHFHGAIGQYKDRPIAIAGWDNLETEIYDWNTREWETSAEWKLNFIREYHGNARRLIDFPVVSLPNYIVVFGGEWYNKHYKSNKIGSIE